MLVAEFSYCLGQSWDFVNESLTLPQITSYRRYWKLSPPVHVLASAYLKYKTPDPEKDRNESIEQMAQKMGVPLPPPVASGKTQLTVEEWEARMMAQVQNVR